MNSFLSGTSMRRIVSHLLLLSFILLFVCTGVQAATGGYTVKPYVYDQDLIDKGLVDSSGADGTCTFWELPLWIQVAEISGTLVTIFGMFRGILWCHLGCRKIAKHNVLDNTVRSVMFEHICNNPGITFSALARECTIGKGIQQYHLKMLQREHKIISANRNGYTGYFENSGKYEVFRQTVIMQLRSTTVQQIYEILILHPNASRKEVTGYLGISGSAVTWQMDRLCADGTVSATKSGKYVHYLINPKAKEILRDYLPNHPVADATGQAQKGSSEPWPTVRVTPGKTSSSD